MKIRWIRWWKGEFDSSTAITKDGDYFIIFPILESEKGRTGLCGISVNLKRFSGTEEDLKELLKKAKEHYSEYLSYGNIIKNQGVKLIER